ncbi:MAG: hypothetical protein K8F25_09335 [Fimbriimonadaceae bacterium]|nr:hypothetical protein [Alphaproteobacteria bacterium]
MIRVVNFVAIMFMVLASFALYRVKYETKDYAQQVSDLREQIKAERSAINVLKAEWTVLNEPERVQRLAKRYLELQSMDVHQIVTFRELPGRADNSGVFEADKPVGGFAGGNVTIQ